jgi:hypothetical protein
VRLLLKALLDFSESLCIALQIAAHHGLHRAAITTNELCEHIARKHRRKLDIEPKGLADAARQLRAKFSDDQIRTGAQSLVAHLAKLYGDRETVV